MSQTSRYVIGIDLGTTHCSLAYVDTQSPEPELKLLAIPQWEGEGQIRSDVRLPSFAWILPKSLIKQGARRLPWQDPEHKPSIVLGREAKFRALELSDQVAFAAKSWLSVGPKSTRQAQILPWGSQSLSGEQKISPVQVQTLLLSHLASAWNAEHTEAPFQDQRIVITVPASFDELAQRLTLEAAAKAGFPASVELLEEPLAAFYAWLAESTPSPQSQDETVLVCDIGGGTSDFTLLRSHAREGTTTMERLAVSEHILLGGDNLDLALTEALQAKMGPHPLSRKAYQLLYAQARQLKEQVLSTSGSDEETFHVSVPLEDQKLFGSYASASLERRELTQILVEGFFPEVPFTAVPQKPEAGLQQLGLAYAADSAITRHLAAFLKEQRPTAVLCAGGTLLSPHLRQRLLDTLAHWYGSPLHVLSVKEPDLAIARGAAWYLWQKQVGSPMVRSPYPRSLYLELTDSQGQAQYLCVVAKGQERQVAHRIEHVPLQARLGQSVRFPLYSSLEAPLKSVTQRPESWQALPVLTTELQSKGRDTLVPVVLESLIRETGLLELRCCTREAPFQEWILDFSLHETPSLFEEAPLRVATTPMPSRLQNALQEVEGMFQNKSSSPFPIEQLPKWIEEKSGIVRDQWTLNELRALADLLLPALHRRERSLEHEATWYYLTGYSLRPGWGAAHDADRMKKLWPLWEHGMSKNSAAQRRLSDQYMILWRRVAGGLSQAQQERILDRILPQLRKPSECSPEILRLAASLERVSQDKKAMLGRIFVQQLTQGVKDQLDARCWALARISSRLPLAAGTEAVLPPHLIEEWAEALENLPWPSKNYQRLALFYLWSARRTGQNALDLEPHYRERFRKKLQLAGYDPKLLAELDNPVRRRTQDQEALFGETLPAGFLLDS